MMSVVERVRYRSWMNKNRYELEELFADIEYQRENMKGVLDKSSEEMFDNLSEILWAFAYTSILDSHNGLNKRMPILITKKFSNPYFVELYRDDIKVIEEIVRRWVYERDMIYRREDHWKIIKKVRQWIKKYSSDFWILPKFDEDSDYTPSENEDI